MPLSTSELKETENSISVWLSCITIKVLFSCDNVSVNISFLGHENLDVGLDEILVDLRVIIGLDSTVELMEFNFLWDTQPIIL